MSGVIYKKHQSLDGVFSEATYSDDGAFRYNLRRTWGSQGKKRLCFIMLNPSTATEEKNDPTVERCERRARAGDYSGLTILNLFAYRATDPIDMKKVFDPVGPANDLFIGDALTFAKGGSIDIICGWGTHGGHVNRDRDVLKMFDAAGVKPMALFVTKDGFPKHPLYCSYGMKPIPLLGE